MEYTIIDLYIISATW